MFCSCAFCHLLATNGGLPLSTPNSCKLLLAFLKTHRRVKLKVSIRAAMGSMAVACLFSAKGLGGAGVSPCDLLASFINPLVRRAPCRRGLFAASCDFLTGLKLLFCVAQFRLSACVASPRFLPSPICSSPSPLFFPHHHFALCWNLSLRLMQVRLQKVFSFFFGSHFWRCAPTGSRKKQ